MWRCRPAGARSSKDRSWPKGVTSARVRVAARRDLAGRLRGPGPNVHPSGTGGVPPPPWHEVRQPAVVACRLGSRHGGRVERGDLRDAIEGPRVDGLPAGGARCALVAGGRPRGARRVGQRRNRGRPIYIPRGGERLRPLKGVATVPVHLTPLRETWPRYVRFRRDLDA